MKKSNNLILAIDGHDGSGKTTLAKLLAEKVNGIYVRPFAEDAGVKLIEYFEKKEYEKVSLFGREMIRQHDELYDNEILIYDRHWMTVFSLLPESYWNERIWHPLPPTTLCFSDLENSLTRLRKRMEKSYEESYHTYYLDLYKKLATRFGANILRTDEHTIEACLKELMEWYKMSLAL
jgi:thymidylate kinase